MNRVLTALSVLAIAMLTSCGSDPVATDPATLCQPGSAAPAWLQEGESVDIAIACQASDGPASVSFALIDPPAGITFDPATATLSWTPGLDQAAVHRIAVEVTDTGERGEVIIGVADAFDDPANVPVQDQAAYTHEYGVPVLFLDVGPSQSEVDEPVSVTYQGRVIPARGEKRGASSLSYPKNSYLLKFENDQQFYDIEKDFVAKRRVVLTSTFDDNSYVRQRLVFELWNALEPTMPIRAYNVVVFIGGSYWGLYTLTDHPSKHWLEDLDLNPDADLFKAFNHDANFRATDRQGNPKATLHQGFEKKNGVPEDDFSEMDSLVDFTINSSDADFAAQLASRIDVDDYNKWWALVVFTLATDSAGKNSYHYFDASQDDPRWHVAPWDFNASFGQSWETSRLDVAAVDQFRTRNEIFLRSLDDPTLGPAIRKVLTDALETGPFSSASLETHLDALIAELDPSSRRDWRKWATDYASHPRWAGRTDMTDYDGELAYLRSWLSARGATVSAAIE